MNVLKCVAAATTMAVIAATPAFSRAADSLPEPNIVDVAGDANYKTDTDTALPVQVDPAADILGGWFTTSGGRVVAHLRVAGNPLESPVRLNYQMWANGPEQGWVRNPTGRTCVVWGGETPGATENFAPAAVARDWCWNDGSLDAGMNVKALEDGTFLVSMSAPRSMTPAFRSGKLLENPYMVVRQHIESEWPVVDTTETGSSYRLP